MHHEADEADDEEILSSTFSDEHLEAAAGPGRQAGVPLSQPGQPWCTAPQPHGRRRPSKETWRPLGCS